MSTSKKLKKIIFIYFMAANLILGLGIFVGTTVGFYRQLENMTLDKLARSVHDRVEAISEWLRLAIMISSHSARLESSVKMLEDFYHGKITTVNMKEASAQLLDELIRSYRDVSGMIRLDKDFHELIRRGQTLPQNYTEYLSSELNKPQVVILNDSKHDPVLLIYSPILADNQFLGLDVARMDLDPIYRLVSEIEDLSFSYQLYLLAFNKKEPFLVASSTNWVRGENLPSEINSVIKLMLNQGLKIYRDKGQTFAINNVDQTDWQLIVSVSDKDMLSPIFADLKNLALIFLGIFILGLIGLWLLALRPLTFLVAATTGALEGQVAQTAQKLAQQSVGLKQTEDRLAMTSHRMQVAQKAKNQFLTNLSHEIRTPLNAIIGLTDLTLFSDLNYEQRSNLREVKDAAEILLTNINSLLDLSKLEADLLGLEKRDFSLKLLIDKLLPSYQAVAKAKGIKFFCQMAGDVPHWLKGDAIRLRQVLNYLLDNAMKFTLEGEVNLEIFIKKNEKGMDDSDNSIEIIFEIKDTGVGIASDRLPFIFEPFSQADSSLTRSFGGSGMGLVVTKKLVELMGGQIFLNSSVGQGSVFIVQVPFEPSPASFVKNVIVPLTIAGLAGKVAAVADDDAINRYIIASYLQKWNMTVHIFDNGLELLNFLNSTPPPEIDIFIVDQLMPGLRAEDLCRHLEKSAPAIPVIFLSSADDNIFLNKELADTSCRLVNLSKPVNRDILLDNLCALLAEKHPKVSSEAWLENVSPPEKMAQKVKERLAKTTKPRNILVVDDNLLNQKVAKSLLQKRGHFVDVADNGEKALLALSKKKYDVVLMDIQMPVMDGLTAVRKIREFSEKYGTMPVVAMTAHALPGDQEQFLEAGMTGYISKPFKPEDLIGIAEAE